MRQLSGALNSSLKGTLIRVDMTAKFSRHPGVKLFDVTFFRTAGDSTAATFSILILHVTKIFRTFINTFFLPVKKSLFNLNLFNMLINNQFITVKRQQLQYQNHFKAKNELISDWFVTNPFLFNQTQATTFIFFSIYFI